ncbi:MAG: hypothetical protein H6839_14065 [Planctomycetes bacterium]|nr:hypothetical protein [Planctomycetota bacterium]
MARWILLFISGAVLFGAPLAADTVVQYQDDVYLRDHETVRYRVDIDYGTGTSAQLNATVRGFDTPPRVRILDSNYRELRDVRDSDGDWQVEPSITAFDSHDHYFIEVDSANAWHEGLFEVTITVGADSADNPDADVSFVKYFYDYESGDPSDHNDCAANVGASGWPLALIATLGAAAVLLRRRRLRPARQRS